MTKIRVSGCVIFDDQQRLLLLHRNKNGKDQWETPGGKVEIGEADNVTAIREVSEEVGVVVKLIRKIGEGDFWDDDREYHYVWFVGKLDDNQINLTLEPGFIDFTYVTINDLKQTSLNLSSGTKKLIELHLSGELNLNTD